MADYRRMISYMYQYENGVKRKNVGYARIEAKSGQCKVTLHMQLLGQSDSIFPTYLIHREDDQMDLIYLGDSVLKNQIMDSRLTADEGNVMGSGWKLSDMGGLLLFLNENVFFASEWDDKPIISKEVLEALKPKKKHHAQEAEISNQAAEVNAINKNPEQGIVSEASINEPEIIPDIIDGLSLEEQLKIPKYKLPRGFKTIERFQRTIAPELGFLQANNILQQVQEPENQYINQEYQQDISRMEDSQDVGQQAENQDTERQAESQDADRQVESLDIGQQAGDPANIGDQEEHAVAKHFFTNYPRIYPFEDNEILLCVKIEPKEIGLLPKDLWALSNNSFLMHGYYCYHHLIFAKMKDGSSFRYILGIPGIFHNREQFMARMFGFDFFKSIRKRDLRQGDFGYWYLPINF